MSLKDIAESTDGEKKLVLTFQSVLKERAILNNHAKLLKKAVENLEACVKYDTNAAKKKKLRLQKIKLWFKRS